MRMTWEDRKGFGFVDSYKITDKPIFSFNYAWFLLTDEMSQYVESHEYGHWNKDMSLEQRQEVVNFYNNWTEPVIVQPDSTIESRLDELKEYRKQIEFGGFSFNGTHLGSDREDQRKIDGAVMGARLNPETIINFKTESGYVQLDAPTMISIGEALFNHVQACHTREMELIEELEDDINTDITIGWPGEAK